MRFGVRAGLCLQAAPGSSVKADVYVIEVVSGNRTAIFHTFPAAPGHPDFLFPDHVFNV